MGCVLSAIRSSGRTKSTSVVCVRRCWNATAIVVERVTRAAVTAVDHGSSPGTGEVGLAPDDFTLSGLPCEDPPHTRCHSLMPPLLLELWRELHPDAHEQTALNFSPARRPATPKLLFTSDIGRSSRESELLCTSRTCNHSATSG